MRRLLIVLLVVGLAGCQPSRSFLGTWTSSEYTVSFNSDGTVMSGNASEGKTGTWRTVGDHRVELKNAAGEASISQWSVSEDGKTLTMTLVSGVGVSGGTTVLTRK